MDPTLIFAIISSTIAFLSMLGGGYMALSHLKLRRENKKEKEENIKLKEKIDLAEDIRESLKEELECNLKDLCEENSKTFITKEESDSENQKIIKSMKETNEQIANKLDHMIRINHKVETKNIRHIIVHFADDLRNGLYRSEVSYRNIMEYYDYYKNTLHENSYIEQEIAFIKE